jgi:hypothetical protein
VETKNSTRRQALRLASLSSSTALIRSAVHVAALPIHTRTFISGQWDTCDDLLLMERRSNERLRWLHPILGWVETRSLRGLPRNVLNAEQLRSAPPKLHLPST